MSDVLLTTASTALTLNGASLNMSSLNQLNNTNYTISNGSLSLSPSGNVVGANASDVIFLGGNSSNLTIATSLIINFGGVNVAQGGGILNITGPVSIASQSASLAKIGAGTLNLSGNYGAFGGSLAISGGTMNLLPGFQVTTASRTGLSVGNPNTGVGNAVTLNVQTSVQFRGLNGTIATPSSGVNTANINLTGPAVELRLEADIVPGGSFAGTISGSGSVRINLGNPTTAQTFSGANTYSGTTTVNGATLRINGVTTGQGDYTVRTTATSLALLTGSGTIGLAVNGKITVGGGVEMSRLSAGGDSATGTLRVITSGTGGVIFGSQGVFLVDIGSGGGSDLLAIAGGYIDLTSSSDTLELKGLAGAFDGSAYTVASFTQNLGGGTFNTVTGLPSNYRVAYTPTSIMLLPIPEPATWALGVQAVAMLVWWKRRNRKGSPGASTTR